MATKNIAKQDLGNWYLLLFPGHITKKFRTYISKHTISLIKIENQDKCVFLAHRTGRGGGQMSYSNVIYLAYECSRVMWMLQTLKEHSWTLDAPAEWTKCKFRKVTWPIMARKLKYVKQVSSFSWYALTFTFSELTVAMLISDVPE